MVDSKTKVKFTESEIQSLLERAFGQVQLISITELVEGYFNTAYEIVLPDRKVVLKISPPRDAETLTYEDNLIRAEVNAMQLVTKNVNIPVPKILYHDFSRTLIPHDYYFMEFVDGVPLSKIRDQLSDEQFCEVEHQLGQITAKINSISHSTFGYFGQSQQFHSWYDAFYWMCQLLFEDAKKYQIALPIEEPDFITQLEAHRAIFDEVIVPQLVHWDIWAGNIFIRLVDDKPRIVGIIDFERALWGDPLMEFYAFQFSNLSAYVDGYGHNILATRNQRLRRMFYNIYLGLILIIEDGPRQYDDKGTIQWGTDLLNRNVAMLKHGDVIE